MGGCRVHEVCAADSRGRCASTVLRHASTLLQHSHRTCSSRMSALTDCYATYGTTMAGLEVRSEVCS